MTDKASLVHAIVQQCDSGTGRRRSMRGNASIHYKSRAWRSLSFDWIWPAWTEFCLAGGLLPDDRHSGSYRIRDGWPTVS